MTPEVMLAAPSSGSPWRAWGKLLQFCFWRHLRIRQMVWIALSLLALATLAVLIVDTMAGWDLAERRPRRRSLEYGETAALIQTVSAFGQWAPGISATAEAVAASAGSYLTHTEFAVFSRWVVFQVFLGYLMPLLTLAFATSSLGSERESRSLIWLLNRPLPRWSIYLAKFLSTLPWVVALNLLGLAGICWAAGPPGERAFVQYWPAVVGGTLAYTALFHAMGSIFRRPAVIALLYAFFVENFVGDLPGSWKRISISFYTRCLVYEGAEAEGWSLTNPTIFMPVLPSTAWIMLGVLTVGLTFVGMAWFARAEYRENV